MSQLRSIESTILYEQKLRKNNKSNDPLVERLRSVLSRDEPWKVFK